MAELNADWYNSLTQNQKEGFGYLGALAAAGGDFSLVTRNAPNDRGSGDDASFTVKAPKPAAPPPAPEPAASSGGGGGGRRGGGGGGGGLAVQTGPDIEKPPSTLEPYVRDVQPAELVSSQLFSLLRSDSPYMQEARARAVRYANKRGVQNSSIAATAGEKGAIEAAFPIAAGNAATESTQALVNQEAINRARTVTFQEAQANWRTAQQIALGYYDVNSANQRAANALEYNYAALSQNRELALLSLEAQTRSFYDQQIAQISTLGLPAAQYSGALEAINAQREISLQWYKNFRIL